ncbi:hypothetical protein FNF31_04188 [Cafeteria roenbergensis]|nr:hypothetical protein FNF31_04188 [Cafeteria roenbergensis]
MFEIVTSGSLDDNSAYAYMVFSTHFASTCIVAEEPESGAPLGFVMGYCPPTDPEAFFCWQVGVTEAARGRGVARRMMESLCKGLADTSGVKYLEATVTPDNEASRRLFAGFGRRAGCPVKVTEDHFPQAMFPPGHDAEGLFRVGPFEASDIGAHDSGRA